MAQDPTTTAHAGDDAAGRDRAAREPAGGAGPGAGRRPADRPDRAGRAAGAAGDARARRHRHQLDHLLRQQGAAAADHDLRHDAGERAHQGHGAGRQRAERDGGEAARDRHRRRRPDRAAGLLRPAVRRQERGAEVPRQVRGRARPDRHDLDRARAAQDQDADRHRQARQAVRRQSRLFPDARGLHRRPAAPSSRRSTSRSSRPWPRRSRARTTCSRRSGCATCAPPATISSGGCTISC